MPSRHTGSSDTMLLSHCALSFETHSGLERLSEYPVLPDMKQIGPQPQRAEAVEAVKRTGSTEVVLDSSRPKKALSSLKENEEAETRVNL